MTLKETRQILWDHETPGYHSWSTAVEQGYPYETADCDECIYARELVNAAGAREYSRKHDARFSGRN
jgi:hypothetical protein